jgi:hypothetical protein
MSKMLRTYSADFLSEGSSVSFGIYDAVEKL